MTCFQGSLSSLVNWLFKLRQLNSSQWLFATVSTHVRQLSEGGQWWSIQLDSISATSSTMVFVHR